MTILTTGRACVLSIDAILRATKRDDLDAAWCDVIASALHEAAEHVTAEAQRRRASERAMVVEN